MRSIKITKGLYIIPKAGLDLQKAETHFRQLMHKKEMHELRDLTPNFLRKFKTFH